MRETATLRKRIINNQVLQRKTLHDILQNDLTQHTVIWISTRPVSQAPCEWTKDFWNKYQGNYGSSTMVRPIIVESVVHATQCKVPKYVTAEEVTDDSKAKKNVENIFWVEEQWDIQNSITQRVGLDKYMWEKPETPAAIVIVRPDLYVAYSSLVRSPNDINQAFEFLNREFQF